MHMCKRVCVIMEMCLHLSSWPCNNTANGSYTFINSFQKHLSFYNDGQMSRKHRRIVKKETVVHIAVPVDNYLFFLCRHIHICG